MKITKTKCICNKKFTKYRNQKYCSIECAHKALRKRVEVKCSECNKIFEVIKSKYKKSKTKMFFCSRKCKDLAQSIYEGSGKLTPKHYKNGLRTYKHKAMRKLDNKCTGCGIKEKY